MATTHANINQYYDSEEDEIQFFPLESYIDSSRADHEEEPEEEEEAEGAVGDEVTVAEGRREEEEEEIVLGEEAASAAEVAVADNNAGNERAEQGSHCRRWRRARDRSLPCLPPVPQFNPFIHTTAPHEQHTRYPIGFDGHGGALAFFELFFDATVFEQLAENTNRYAIFKHAGDLGHRRWTAKLAAELRIFIGIIIYMGVFPSAQVSDYWRHDSNYPFHRIGLYISQNHFEQLKRYFHISPQYESLPRSRVRYGADGAPKNAGTRAVSPPLPTQGPGAECLFRHSLPLSPLRPPPHPYPRRVPVKERW